MQEFAFVVLVTLLGGGVLLVGLIIAIVTGSSRSSRLAKLEKELLDVKMGLHQAYGRIHHLERVLGGEMEKIAQLAAHPPAVAPVVEALPGVRAKGEEGAAVVAPVAAVPAPVPVPVPTDSAPVPVPVSASGPAPDPAGSPLPAPGSGSGTHDHDHDHGDEHEDEDEDEKPAAGPARPEIPSWPRPGAGEPLPAAPVMPSPAARAAPPQERPPPRAAQARPPEPPARIDWERWVGVRGAAALGACVLVIAGLYFFKYSIDAGLISPSLRVVLGTLVGLGGIVGSQVTLRKNYTVLANWLAGAGVAILYTAFWAAHSAYQLIGGPISFALMILVTAACGVLSVRNSSMVIALLGLFGGFATPVALSSGSDHPIGLFGYLLMLDGALLYLSFKKRWPVLGALSLFATFLYQAVWIDSRMGPDRIFLGMGVVVVFGGVYAFAMARESEEKGGIWAVTRVASVLLPFGFGLYFGLRSDLGERFYPLALMLCVLCAGAAWIARAKRQGWMSLGAAIASLASCAGWLVRHEPAHVAGEVVGLLLLLAVVFHGFLELERRTPREEAGAPWSSRASVVASFGALVLLVLTAAAPSCVDPWPWTVGWVVAAALCVRHSAFPGRPSLRLVTSLALSLGFIVVHMSHAGAEGFPGERVHLVGAAIVTLLAVVVAALMRREPVAADGDLGAKPQPTRADELALLTPFLFAVCFSLRVPGLTPHLAPTGIMISVLAAAGGFVARARPRSSWVAFGAAIGGVVTLLAWLQRHDPLAIAAEAVALTCLFAATLHAFVELEHRATPGVVGRWITVGSSTASLGAMTLLLLTAASPGAVTPWPWLVGTFALGAVALRHGSLAAPMPLHLGVALILGVGLPVVHAAHSVTEGFPGGAVYLGVAVAAGVALTAVALSRREVEVKRWASHAAALLPVLLLCDIVTQPVAPAPPAVVFLAALCLLALALLSAARLGSGAWAMVATAVAAFVQLGWVLREVPERAVRSHELTVAVTALVGQALAVALCVAWPLLAGARLRGQRWAFRAAALAGPLWFGGLYWAWVSAFGKSFIGALPVLLGAGLCAAAMRARPLLPAGDPVRRSALVWLLGVSVSFVSLAIPLQLDNEWVTVGWALEAVAMLALWRRLDHAGLKYTALAHLFVVVVRLGGNPWVLEYHPRASFPVLNWLAYTYWLPVLALLGAWKLLQDLEAKRARPWERGFYAGGSPLGANASAASAIVLFFVWINLTILDAFGTGAALRVVLDRMPARDLTLSLAWAIYALVLLATGMIRSSAALRWTSLALIIVTLGKVFLYDLAHLHDLYRVASLVGLALSLILISLAYQRFVFGKKPEDATPGEKPPEPPADNAEETQ